MFKPKKQATTGFAERRGETQYIQGLNNLLQISAISANESKTVEEAFQLVLNAVCLFMDWPIGHVYIVNERNSLDPLDIWYIRDPEKFRNFYETTMKTVFMIGEGLPGRILSLGKPTWIEDITKDFNFLRTRSSEEASLKSAFGLPIMSDNRVIAVMEFFNEKAIKPDYYFLGVIGQIGVQLGRIVEKKISSEKLSRQVEELEARNEDAKYTSKAMFNIFDDLVMIQKNLKNEKNKLKIILEGIGDGAFSIDVLGRIGFFNKVAEEISGYKVDEVIGKQYRSILRFVSEKDDSENYKFIEEVFTKGIISQISNHIILITKDGKRIPVEGSVATLKDGSGKIIGAVVIFRDVAKARDLEKTKTNFISIASHQLRTPLTALRWISELFLSGHLGKLTERQDGYLKDMNTSTQRLLDLVEILLMSSRVEEGRVDIKPVPTDIAMLTREVITDLEPLIKAKNLNLVMTDKLLPKINLEPEMFRQVILNLISNAVKYTPNGGRITVRFELGQDFVTCSVEDTGIGVPKKNQYRIFEKFFRADNASMEAPEGTGLGLNLAKSIVLTWGGDIGFKSEEGKGTAFYFTIPLAGIKPHSGEVKINV